MSISPRGLSPREIDDLKYARLTAIQWRADGQGWSGLDAAPYYQKWIGQDVFLQSMTEDLLYCFPMGLILQADWKQLDWLCGPIDEFPPLLMGIYDSIPDGSRPGVRVYSSGLTEIQVVEGIYNLVSWEIEQTENLDLVQAWAVFGFHNNPVAAMSLWTLQTLYGSNERPLQKRPSSFLFNSSADWTAGEVPEDLGSATWTQTTLGWIPGLVFG